MPRKRRSYTIKERRDIMDAVRGSSQHEVELRFGVPRRDIRRWLVEEDIIRAFMGSERTKSMKRGGSELLPFSERLLMFMKDERREEKVCTIIVC